MIKETIKEHRWFRLDNAAKIYPVVSSAKNSNIYRMGVLMKEKVDPVKLQEAILEVRDRFPSFFVKLRRGLFWYYYDVNGKDPVLFPESPFVCQSIKNHTNNGFHFTFFYYENRISLEVFHSLSDGSGSFHLLKAVLFRYLEKIGKPQLNDGSIKMIEEMPSIDELEDSYNTYFTTEKRLKEPRDLAYRVKGKRFSRRGVSITAGRMMVKDLYDLASKHDSKITEFIVALWIYSLWKTGDRKQLSKRPISVTVPVNMRRYFRSESLRNFSLFFVTTIQGGYEEPDFDLILAQIKEQFKTGREMKKLQNRLNMNVAFEKNLLIKICPLFLKKLMFKIGYSLIGHRPITSSVSNFGEITLPETMANEINFFEFNLASGLKPGMAVNSFNGMITCVINRCKKESYLEETFFSFLGQNGVKVTIHSNEWV